MNLRHVLTRKIGLWVLLPLAAGTAYTFQATRTAASEPPQLASVSSAELQSHGVELLLPAVPAVTIGVGVAEREATMRLFPGSRVREAVLARVRSRYVPIVDGCTCWIVSIVPPGGIVHPSAGPGGTRPILGRYMLLYIDAGTGRFLYGTIG